MDERTRFEQASDGPTRGEGSGDGPDRARRVRRGLTGVALAGALAVGGLTVAALNPLGSAGAQGDTTTTTTAPAPGRDGAGHAGGRAGAPGKVLDDALAALVEDGTLTQAQADAVTAEVATTAEAARAEGRAAQTERRKATLDAAAGALGITADELTAELKDGSTLAEVAEAHGVEVQKVTDALVAAADARIDEAVAAGRIDAEKAADMKAKAAERIQKMVEEGGRFRGPRG